MRDPTHDDKEDQVALFRSRSSQREATLVADNWRHAFLGRLEAVAEAMEAGNGGVEACLVAGRELARDGVSLPEALSALQKVSLETVGRDPDYQAVEALCMAWSETTLGYLHAISCEDPLTGLSSLAHVRARLTELYRGELRDGVRVQDAYAMVVVALPTPAVSASATDPVGRSLRMARIGDEARTVFPTAESIGRIGQRRVVVLTRRDERLGRRVALLRSMLNAAEDGPAGPPLRIWIEGLPTNDGGAGHLLDELAR